MDIISYRIKKHFNIYIGEVLPRSERDRQLITVLERVGLELSLIPNILQENIIDRVALQ